MAKNNKTQKTKAFASALKKLQAEAGKRGLTVSHLINTLNEKNKTKALAPARTIPLPRELLRHLIYTTAGKANRTPGQHLKSVLRSEPDVVSPKGLQNWYSQIYGEFAQGSLAEVLSEVLLSTTNRGGGSLMLRVRAAIRNGDIRYLEQIVRCVAFVHGIKHENYGTRVANRTRRDVGFAYLRLYELENKPPTAREIQVLLARNSCIRSNYVQLPKFSDIWYFLRSGPINDSAGMPTRDSRYELTGVRNIRKVMKSFRWLLSRAPDGPLTVTAVVTILDKIQLKYLDDSQTVSGT